MKEEYLSIETITKIALLEKALKEIKEVLETKTNKYDYELLQEIEDIVDNVLD